MAGGPQTFGHIAYVRTNQTPANEKKVLDDLMKKNTQARPDMK